MRNRVIAQVARASVYACFLVLFWVPVYWLVCVLGFTENSALIAATVGVVPLLLLFVPLFEGLAQRVSALKLGGVAFEFERAIGESVRGPVAERVVPTVDAGREVVYGKANLDDFVSIVRKYLPQPSKRLVMSLDLTQGEGIHVPMLYFQMRHLLSFFDLRALLFIDTRQQGLESRILGTVSPHLAIREMDRYVEGMDRAYDDAWREQEAFFRGGDVEGFIRETWNRFSVHAVAHPADRNLRLTDEVYRIVFADHVETNVIAYPVEAREYGALLHYLEPPHVHLILVQEGDVVNVRTIDRVAREMARSIVEMAMRQRSTER